MHMQRLLLCLLLLPIAACDRDDEPRTPCYVPEFRHIDPELIDHLFERDSWWVYQNEWDASLDTVTVQSILRTTYEYEVINGTGNMTGGCPSTTYTGEQFIVRHVGQLYYEDIQFGVMNDVITRGGPQRAFLFFAGAQVGETRTTATIEAIHDSITLGNHTFYNVTQVGLSAQDQLSWWPRRLYFAPHVGIVRREWAYPDTLRAPNNLVEWQVTPYPY